MSGLIKQTVPRPTRVRATTSSRPAVREGWLETYVSPEVVGLRDQAAQLESQLEAKVAEIERLQSEVERARREGREEGWESGRQAAEDHNAEALKKLDQGIAQALDRFSTNLTSMDALALEIAHHGLHKVLGDKARYAELLQDILQRQLALVGDQAVIRVQVSAEDFLDVEGLAALGAATRRCGLRVETADSLKSGECRMRLQLGALEIGVAQQWGRLSAALEELASGGAPE